MKTRIIIDSTTDLLPDSKSKVHIVPLTVHFNNEEYLDGVTINHKTFYEKLIESDIMPTTSQATPIDFEKEYENAKASNEDAVVITLSSKLSGTYQSAVIAKENYDNIFVVDSGSGSIGSGILTKTAISYAENGMSAAEIAKKLEEDKKKIVIVALIDTLEYLKKGGRISKTVAFAGAMLNIKPVISVIDGDIKILGKARGSKMGNNLLAQEIEKTGGIDFTKPILLGYTGISDALLKKYIDDCKHMWADNLETVDYTCIGSVIGTHAGPGAIAVAFFKK